jgi:hypothetical protein
MLTSYSGDQFGFYTVGDKFKTYSKLQAIEEMQRTGIHLEWHFNKAYYSRYSWTTEPTESLDELYRCRAQEIRDSYDYVVIWYSGGPDSWCVLNSFLKNNIKIDEIGQIYSYDADKDKHSVFNEEIFYTAIPQTQKILEENPGIVHRVIDISELISKIYLHPNVKYDHIYNIKGIASANSLARSYIREYVDDYKKIIDSGKKVCFIWGCEKPRLKEIQGKYHTCFLDVFDITNIRIQSLSNQGYFDEWFYWDPSTAPIVAKQSHILLKILNNESANPDWFVDKHWSHSPKSRNNNKFLRNDIYHTAIYPGWQPDTIVAPKPMNLMISERDNWFWNQNPETTPAVQIAQGGIKQLRSRIGDYWFNNPADITRGIKGCINSYALE